MSEPLQMAYEFGGFRLVPADRQLVRGGKSVALAPKVFDTLVLLVESGGRLVEKDEFLARIWPDTVVEEVGLAHNISQLRRALRNGTQDSAFIETVPTRGYRFVVPVSVVSSGHQEPQTRILLGVLPFENLVGDPEREYLADSLTEEVISSLGQIDPDHLAVIGRTSMMTYKRTTKSIAEIGRELNAPYLIESSIRAEGGRLRVTTKLICVADQSATWSASFDGEPTSLLAFQRELSTAIGEQIRLRLSPERLDALARRHTANADAYDLYLRGRYFWNQLTPATNARAVEYFERAIALDPDYALAWCGMAYAFLGSSMNGDAPPLKVLSRAHEAAARAVQADPDLADAQSAVGYVKFLLEWDWPGAEAALRRAIALDPACALGYRMLGHLLSQTGRQAEARSAMCRLCELDPLYAMNHAMSSQVAFQARDYSAALEHARQAITIDPEFWIGYMELAQAYEQLGKPDLALEALMTASRLSGGNSKTISLRGYVLAKMGRAGEARDLLKMLETVSRERYVPPFAMALVHAGLSGRDAVFDWLNKACVARDVHLLFLTVDPKWDPYRTDPRFEAILTSCGFTRPARTDPLTQRAKDLDQHKPVGKRERAIN
jgi:TolB-like protein/Flp pilus assembly protein TadD